MSREDERTHPNRQERFDFLGYSFGPHRYKANGKWYLSASPSKKSVQRLKTKVGYLLVPSNNDPWPEVRDTLNRSLLGWSNYFCQGTCRSAFRGVDQYVYERVRDFLARRHIGFVLLFGDWTIRLGVYLIGADGGQRGRSINADRGTSSPSTTDWTA